jgi:hypothetical protein
MKQVLTGSSQRLRCILGHGRHLYDSRGREAFPLLPAGSGTLYWFALDEDQPEAEEAMTFET